MKIPAYSACKREFLLDEQYRRATLLIEQGNDVSYLFNNIGLNAFVRLI